MSKLVFLGGTVGKNHWREERVIPSLVAMGISEDTLFNPVVSGWNEAAQQREDQVKKDADYLLFVIASTLIPGNEVSAYSLVELTMALYDDPSRTVVALDDSSLSLHAAKHIRKGFKDLRQRFPEAPIFDSIDEAVHWLGHRLLSR